MEKGFTYKLVFAHKRTVEYRLQHPRQIDRLGRVYSHFLSKYEKSGLSEGLQRRVFLNRQLRHMVMAGQRVSTTYARKVLKLK